MYFFKAKSRRFQSYKKWEVFLLVPLDITSLILFLMEKGKKPVSHSGLVQAVLTTFHTNVTVKLNILNIYEYWCLLLNWLIEAVSSSEQCIDLIGTIHSGGRGGSRPGGYNSNMGYGKSCNADTVLLSFVTMLSVWCYSITPAGRLLSWYNHWSISFFFFISKLDEAMWSLTEVTQFKIKGTTSKGMFFKMLGYHSGKSILVSIKVVNHPGCLNGSK